MTSRARSIVPHDFGRHESIDYREYDLKADVWFFSLVTQKPRILNSRSNLGIGLVDERN